MTPSDRIFVHLVSAGMARAHRVAAALERRFPEWQLEPAIVSGRQLDGADPCSLPDCRFIVYEDGQPAIDVVVSLHATGRRMFAVVAAELDALIQEEAGCA